MKLSSIIAVVLISASPCRAGLEQNKALSSSGLTVSGIEIPSPGIPQKGILSASPKIKVNEAQFNVPDMVFITLNRKSDFNGSLKTLSAAGYKVSAYTSETGARLILAEIRDTEGPVKAAALAKYEFVREVLVNQVVYSALAYQDAPKSAGGNLNAAKSSYAVKIGTIKGGMNYSPVDVTINKVAWTITGGMNHSPVNLTIDHAAKTITGGANHSPVNLSFVWSREEITVEGGANLSPIKYTVNWKNGLLEGYASHSPVKLEFDMQEGVVDATIVKITGYAGHAPVDLTYNKVNGHIGGGMNHSPVNIDLVNCDLYDFLNYFFLFVK